MGSGDDWLLDFMATEKATAAAAEKMLSLYASKQTWRYKSYHHQSAVPFRRIALSRLAASSSWELYTSRYVVIGLCLHLPCSACFPP